MRVGAWWGIGHGLGVVVMGALGTWAVTWMNLEPLAAWAEWIVGFLLIGVGIWAIWRSRRIVIHSHEHEHEHSSGQAHLHMHEPGMSHSTSGSHHSHHHAVFGAGLFHGVAGSGHLFGVLPALALPPVQTVVYLTAYVMGAIVSMATLAMLLGWVSTRVGEGGLRRLMSGAGGLAIAIGVLWLTTTH
jgi:uncharacterized membrane protein YfcA